ncbi:hypothetical protein CEXT_59171 [Caerostris extrusa]|uniref:Uncharacterized protein n=1 Tax=Caerostris extrusa TaxID=172846 RepID=A0AAV4U5J2_CAEEX|nr:hypothetical protein CEXT_59171 [Caerostris extrusa]
MLLSNKYRSAYFSINTKNPFYFPLKSSKLSLSGVTGSSSVLEPPIKRSTFPVGGSMDVRCRSTFFLKSRSMVASHGGDQLSITEEDFPRKYRSLT